MSVVTKEAILPHGWIVKTSRQHPDRVYYFNCRTNCSTWECPELVPKPSSDGAKNPESKKDNTKSFDSEPEMGRLITSIHTPEESPQARRDQASNNNTKRTSLKRPLEADPDSPNESPSKVPRPPTAIVNPVIPGLEKKTGKDASRVPPSGSSLVPATGSTPQVSKRLRKSKKKSKNKLLPLPVLQKPALPKRSPASITLELHKQITKSNSVLVRNNISIVQEKASTSTTADTSSDMVLGTPVPTQPSFSSGSSAVPDDYEDSFCEDVEMIDVSANLTSVEEIVASVQGSNRLQSHYIVVDTNIFMHELEHIDELKDMPLSGCGPPHIFIPWVVFKELDGLKLNKTNNGARSKLASNAIRFLHDVLKSKHPRFHGQNAKQANDVKKSYHDNNDDRIIDLCQTLQKKVPPEKVILLTNDKNLANKAMVYQITVHDYESLLKDIPPDCTIQEEVPPKENLPKSPKSTKKRQFSKKTSPQKKKDSDRIIALQEKHHTDPIIALQEKHNQHMLVDQLTAYKEEIDKLMNGAKQSLKDVLDPVLAIEMRRVYNENVWNLNVNRSLLQDITAAYIQHWSPLFHQLFSNENDALNSFQLLHKRLSSTEGQYNTLEECKEFLNAIRTILEGIRLEDPKLPILVREVENIKVACAHIFAECNKLASLLTESTSSQTKEEMPLEILNYNWVVVNELCGMIMDYFGIEHNFVYERPDVIPPESEFRRVSAELYPLLLHLRQLMKKVILEVQSESKNVSLFKKFYKALKELVPSLNVQFVMPDIKNFTTPDLEKFCRKPENRERIKLGWSQLDTFCSKLKEAIEVMVARKNPKPSLL